MTGWENQDLRALRLIGGGLGSFQVLKIEENRMTEQAPEQEMDETWDNAAPAAPAFGGATYPEYPYSLADHVYTWSPKLPDGSMLVIRAQSAEDLADKAEAVATVVGRLRTAWGNVTGAPAPQGAPQGFQGPATPPPFGANVSVPAAPGYVGAPAPQAPAWGGQQPQQGGFGGGAQQGNRQGPKPRPDWPMVYKINVPFQGKDAFKAFREQNKDALRGKVAWAGGGDYWIHGDVVAGFGQYNPMAA
jgi:hypothetical protein